MPSLRPSALGSGCGFSTGAWSSLTAPVQVAAGDPAGAAGRRGAVGAAADRLLRAAAAVSGRAAARPGAQFAAPLRALCPDAGPDKRLGRKLTQCTKQTAQQLSASGITALHQMLTAPDELRAEMIWFADTCAGWGLLMTVTRGASRGAGTAGRPISAGC